MTAIPFHEFAPALSANMLNGMLTGLVLAALAWAMLRLSGRQSSSTRFAVWFAALIAIAALPFVGKLVPTGDLSGSAFTRWPALSLPTSWAMWLVLAWAVIVAIGFIQLAIGLARLRKVRASTVPVHLPALDPVLRKTIEEFRSGRRVTICVSEQQSVPAAIGFLRPLIVFPDWAMRELSAAELNAILIHELAHLQRRDDWTNLLQKVLRIVFFFHPAVWWIESQLSVEREMACDDVVVSHTENARAYAECLVSMAEKSFLRRTLALTQAAVSRVQETSRRVAQILNPDRPGVARAWKPALGLVAVFAVICGITQLRTPELVAFRDSGPETKEFVPSNSVQPKLQLASFRSQATESASLMKQDLRAQVPKHRSARRVSEKTVKPAELKVQPQEPQAEILQAEAKGVSQQPFASPTMLVVFHETQYRAGVRFQWTVWVWQVKLQRHVMDGVAAKGT